MSSIKSQSYEFDKHDLLNRKSSADDLHNLINLMNKCERYNLSLSIAIDSRWGSGKTFFLNMWKNYIIGNPDSHDKVVYYNAWQFDDSESTLIPIVYSIVSGLDVTSTELGKTEDEHEDTSLTKNSERVKSYSKLILKIIGSSAIKNSVQKLFGDNRSLTSLLQRGVDDASDEELKNALHEINSYYEYRRSLADALKDLRPRDGKLWIFIDDLDRCRPSFALETLEDIKHFFDIEDLIFVFAVDMNQLSFSVRKNYGDGVNTSSYVRKFFDYIYLLPSPNLHDYLSKTFDQDKREQLSTNSLDYLCLLYEEYDYSLREINQNISHLYSFLDKHANIIRDIKEALPDNADEGFRIYLFFMIIRDKFHYDYQRIIKGHFSLDGVEPNKYDVFQLHEAIGSKVNKFLDAISDDGVENWVERLKDEYKLFDIALDKSFEKHMESVLA